MWSRVRRGGLLCLFLALGVPAQAAINFVSADVQKPDHPVVLAVQHFGQQVAARSNGEINVQVKANGELGNETEILAKLKNGQLQMARISAGVLADSVPATKLMSLPYLFRSRDHLQNVLKGDFGWRLEGELQKAGLVLLMYLDSGTRNFYAKKALKTKADFAGLRFRVQPSPVYKDLITELGASPVVLAYDKVPEALRNGDVDGAENNIVSYVSAEHYKYAKYLMIDEHSMVPDVLVISKKAWDALKPPQQELLKSVGVESSEFMSKLWADKEKEALAFAKKNGVTVVQKSQMSMTAIESFAIKLYTRYVQDPKDLEMVLQIVSSK